MKFRDGMWLPSPNHTISYAEEIHTITPSSSTTDNPSLTLLCPTRKILSRGNTLNLATLSLTLTAEFDGVVSLEVTHFEGARRRGPDFDLFPSGRPKEAEGVLGVEKDEGAAGEWRVKAGGLTAKVGKEGGDFSITFVGASETGQARTLTSLQTRSVGFAYTPALTTPKQVEDLRDRKHYIFTQTDLSVGESIHGLGERFGAWNKLGQHVTLWNEDGGTSSEQAYKNISFHVSSRGYGVFVDTPDALDLEIGSERCSRLQTAVEGHRLKWYVIHGPRPKDVLTRYAVLTGKPGRPPAWSYGLWLSTSFTTDYDERTVRHFVGTMKEARIPVEVFHFDCFWLRAFHWTDFVWDPAFFPDPKRQIERLKAERLVRKISVWTNPYIGQASPVFKHAAEKGYLLKKTDSDVWQWDLWQTGMGIVDFTNPAACEWFKGCLRGLFDTGVDAIKTDFGERIPTTGVRWFDDAVDPNRMHNYYAFLYNKLVYETLQERYGEHEAVLFARTACAGTQRFPLQWGGDCESTPAALAESVRGGLSLGLAAFASWTSDIGGFEGKPMPWIYKRWVAFGLLCSHSRLHGSNSYRVPWLVDDSSTERENCTDVLRHWVQFKRRLMPYLFAQATESVENGWPTSTRAVALEFPNDPTAWFCDRQFMVGSSILAAPVFEGDGTGELYLPPGIWFNYWTGEKVQGERWLRAKYGFCETPLFVRENTILVLGQEEGEDGFGYEWLKTGGTVRLYGVKSGAKAVLVDAKGVEKGVLEVKGDGELAGMEVLEGAWVVERIG